MALIVRSRNLHSSPIFKLHSEVVGWVIQIECKKCCKCLYCVYVKADLRENYLFFNLKFLLISTFVIGYVESNRTVPFMIGYVASNNTILNM